MAEKTCPVWIGYLLLCPIRKLFQNPKKIFKKHVKSGMKVLDVGSAMGYFSLPFAKMVGKSGEVVCVDIQEGMLSKLVKRANKKKLNSNISTVKCNFESLCISEYENSIDFAVAFAVMHEIKNQSVAFKEIYDVLKPGAKLYFAEPKGHVNEKDFQCSVDLALKQGFVLENEKKEISGNTAVLVKK